MIEERDWEAKLREAVRPVEAPAGLAERIVAAAARRRRNAWLRWGAMAAMLTVATWGGVNWYQQRQVQQLQARQAAEQFTLALEITSRQIHRLQEKIVIQVPLRRDRGESERENR